MFTKPAATPEKQNQPQNSSASESGPLLQKRATGQASPYTAAGILQMQKTMGNRAVMQLLKQTRPLQRASASGQGPIQMNKDKEKLTEDINAAHESGKLTSLDIGTLWPKVQSTLTGMIQAAKLQAVSGFFHKNDSGLLPDCPWILLDGDTACVSPYIEFNISYKEYSRVVYDAISQTLYLTPHYDGFIRLDNVPGTVIQHLNTVTAENVGYLLAGYDSDLNDTVTTAAGKINALKVSIMAKEKRKV